MSPFEHNTDGSITLSVDLSIYCQDAVKSTAYLFTDRCYITVEMGQDGKALVRLSGKTPSTDVEVLAKEFMNALIDEELRARLRRETGEIQRLIVSEAFAPLERSESEE